MNSLNSRIFRTMKTLDVFFDRALGIDYQSDNLTGFHYNRDFLKAAFGKTYLETVGNKADSIHLLIKNTTISTIVDAYLATVRIVGKRFSLNEQDVVLAFDYTDEKFYGKVDSLWIYGYTKEHGVTGKFKFLSCSIVNSDIPQRIPLISIPVPQGHSMAQYVTWCWVMIEPLIKSVKLSLFDRGFYSKDLMYTLSNAEKPYLIFTPKTGKIKKELDSLNRGEKKKVIYNYSLNKDKTVFKGSTTLAILKQIFDKKSKDFYDWSFATNQDSINLDYIVPTYKGRWRIETGFRVQDEARISSKSKDLKIRFFYFAYEQVLQLLWIALYKEELSFKQFLIKLYEMSEARYHEP